MSLYEALLWGKTVAMVFFLCSCKHIVLKVTQALNHLGSSYYKVADILELHAINVGINTQKKSYDKLHFSKIFMLYQCAHETAN